MKKILLICIFSISIFFIVFYVNTHNNKHTNTIKVAEVTHSIFYAPWYVALNEGYFDDENINVEVVLASGADKVAASILSNDVNIGLAGLEASIYVYKNGEKDYIQSFAALTKRDGEFIIGDCKYKGNFNLKDLKGKTILAGRKDGMPLLNFLYALKNENINTNKMIIDTSVDFASLSSAYIGGNGDFVNLFEPNATSLEKNGYGCILDSVGKYTGEVPYTVFMARKSFLQDNKELVQKFNNAINKGLKFVLESNSEATANIIKKSFPETNINDLTNMINNYKENDSWWNNTYITKDSFDRLLDIMENNNSLNENVEFEVLVNNSFNK